MATRDVNLGDDFNVGNTDRLVGAFRKDGGPWTGINQVTLTFEAPNRSTQFTRSMQVEEDAEGTWYYDTVEEDITVPGRWTVSVLIMDDEVTKRYPYEISFFVNDQAGPG